MSEIKEIPNPKPWGATPMIKITINKLSQEELFNQARDYFKSYPETSHFYATEDGMFFTEEYKGSAVDHAREWNIEMYKLERKEFEEVQPQEEKPKESEAPESNTKKTNKTEPI